MKTLISTPKCIATALTVLALAGWIALPTSASAQVKGAGAAKLLPAASAAVPVAVIQTGSKPMSGCSSCRTTLVSVAERSTKTGTASETRLIARNDCADCVNTIVTTGTGKLAKDVVAHACKKCGSETMVCCAKK